MKKPTTVTYISTFNIATWAIFLASVAVTLYFCRRMSGEMPMPGGWRMSMAWMRMPGQSWPGAGAMYLAMWMAMMVAMMGPSVLPVLWEYCRIFSWRAATILAGGYFFIYLLLGAAAYPVGVAMAIMAMRSALVSRRIPILAAGALILAGIIQLTSWKGSHLRRCRDPLTCCVAADDGAPPTAWRAGLRWGKSCVFCCSGLMLALFVLGMMNPYVIGGLTSVISLERLLPRSEPLTRVSGFAAILTGIFQVVHQRLG